MTERNLNPCSDPGPTKEYPDKTPPYCRGDEELPRESLNDVPGRAYAWVDDPTLNKRGDGASALCDPIQKGFILNEQDGVTNRNTLYRYSKSLRGTDEAMREMFNDVVVLDEAGKAFPVPIIWGTQEKAVMAALGQNYRNDPTLVVDRPKLPMMAIHSTDMSFNSQRYTYHKAVNYLRDYRDDWRPGFTIKERWGRDTVFGVSRGLPIDVTYALYVWTLYEEDMNQIIEQIITKIIPLGYIRVKGVGWEVGVKLESIANNIDYEPGDQAIRVLKYQFNMIAETYVPQPIVRKKAVLKIKTDIMTSIDPEVGEAVARLEEAVEELQRD